MKNLPLGMNTLSAMIANDMVYVDKTEFAWNLIKLPGRFFLSRPRRFGKSLFVDTLKEIFEGNQTLFKGLYIHEKWNWNKSYPVIKIDFADGVLGNRQELDEKIREILNTNAHRLGVCFKTDSISGRFADLIAHTSQKFGQPVVVLVDEYDKPILDNIDNPEIAAEMREGLKNLYSVLKGQDANLQFIFMTGVTKFSKVSLFSGVNQLTDITIDAKYSSICGYKEADLNESFAPHLEGADLDAVKHWYNGYSWTGAETVYNPYDILLFIEKGRLFRDYWFETGSPSFLLKLFKKNRYFLPNLENLEVTEDTLESYEVEQINPLTLLFQSGYLTIKDTFTSIGQLIYRIGIPNFEVRLALNNQLINAYSNLNDERIGLQRALHDCLLQGNLEALASRIKRLFAAIPWRNFTNNDLSDFEGYYASVLYAFFASLDARIIPEDITNHGQADMTVMLGDHIYVMEIKVVEQNAIEDNPALLQIVERRYADKYKGTPGKIVHEVGLVFSRDTRGLIKASWQE